MYITQILVQKPGISVAKADVLAKNSQPYQNALKEMETDIAEAIKAKAEMGGLKMKHEALRSQASLKKAEMNLI